MSGSEDIQHLAWIDLETTGLDMYRDPIIEFAMIVTDLELNPPFQGYTPFVTAVNPGNGLLQARLDVTPWAKETHHNNGLLNEVVSDRAMTTDDCQAAAISHLATYCTKGKVAVAGSGVANFDFPVLRKQMPYLAEWFPYFSIDVGSLRRFLKYVVAEEIDTGKPPETHRAFEDIRYTLGQAMIYRDVLRAIISPRSAN